MLALGALCGSVNGLLGMAPLCRPTNTCILELQTDPSLIGPPWHWL